MAEHGALELEAGPESIGDTIAFLRRGQKNGSGSPRGPRARGRRRARAGLLRTRRLLPRPPPRAVLHGPDRSRLRRSSRHPLAASRPTAAPVDVFEELARLPEPVPLTDEPHDYPDMLAPPAFLTSEEPVESAMAEAVPSHQRRR